MTARTALFALLFLAFFGTGSARAEERITLDTRPGVTESFYFTAPEGAPAANLILFTGGEGVLKNYAAVNMHHGNFLVRSRHIFVKEGFAVAVIDAPSDESGGMGRFRLSPEHAADIAAVAAWLHRQNKAPVWLVGTSRGTLSAANGAAHAAGVDGLVLTSSLMLQTPKDDGTVFETELDKIKVPVLVVHNRNDACPYCPFFKTDELLAQFTRAPRKELIPVDGSAPPESEPCEALAAHGYIGIEPRVVTLISDWIKKAQR